jgi:peptide/nickel transport system ATP-binding protein
MQHQALLEIKNLKVQYHTRKGSIKAVDDVSLEIKNGEIFGLAGESGCGKSTLAFSILQLVMHPGSIEEGSIIFNGKDVLKFDEKNLREFRWKEVSIITQSAMNALNPVMRIEDQMVDALFAHGYQSRKEARTLAGETLKLVKIDPSRLRSYPHELSGGMKQRVIMASAMLMHPKLIIADEPTTALDVVVQKDFLQTIKSLKEEFDISVIFISHDLSILAEICDRIGIMYAGKLVEVASTEDIFYNSKHPYTAGLISSTPSVRGPKTMLTGIPGEPPDLISPPNGCRFHPRCTSAIDRCQIEQPELIAIEGSHQVACYLARGK